MGRRFLGLAIVGVGLALALVFGFADPLGLSTTEGGEDEFGALQIVGLAAGVVLLAVGIGLSRIARPKQPAASAGRERPRYQTLHGAPSGQETRPPSAIEEGEPMATKQATTTDTAPENEAAVRRTFEQVWNEGNLSAADELVHPDSVQHDPSMPEEGRGPEGLKHVVSMYRQAFPDLRLVIDDLFSADDKVVSHWHSEGTHRGELRGLAPTGRRVSVTGMSINRFADGKVAEAWTQWDNLGLLQQLGAAPAPGSAGERLSIQVQRASVKARETATRLREKRASASSGG